MHMMIELARHARMYMNLSMHVNLYYSSDVARSRRRFCEALCVRRLGKSWKWKGDK